MDYYLIMSSPNELYHHGIQGMKWGVRRFQNKDGSLTSAGKKRYDTNDSKKNDKKKAVANYNKDYERSIKSQDKADADWVKAKDSYIKTGKNSVSRLINNILFDSVRDTSGQTIRDHINKENDRFKRPTLEDDRKRNSNSNI